MPSSIRLIFRKIVRKELKAAGDTRTQFETELYNLSMLKMLRHPNIVKLLAAYTIKGRHNLLFPKADGKTLASLLESSPPRHFRSLQQMILALSGLSSAIRAMHIFDYPDLEVLAIGCHHDLRPENILVHGEVFLITDFGLSTFKDSNKPSDTSFKNVRGDYVAPECENLEDLSERTVIGRSSDIWSLGCIMLEVITYVVGGTKGVTDFEAERGFKVEDHRRYRFHRGSRAESPAVIMQLDRLHDGMESRAGRKLLLLIREILNLDPRKRPSAAEMNQKMEDISIESLCENVHRQCSRIFQISKSMQAWLVLSKLTSWMRIYKVHQHDLLQQWHPSHNPDYQTTKKCLLNMQEVLTTILPDCKRHLSHVYQPLHDLNHILHDALPKHLQTQAEAVFRSYALNTVDRNGLYEIANDRTSPDNQAEISVLARVRLLNAMIDDESIVGHPELKIDPSSLKRDKLNHKNEEPTSRHAHRVMRSGTNEPIGVLVETKRYADGIDEQCQAELVNRLSKVTKLLREAGPQFCILSCSGFFHEPGRDSCGLVYEYPRSTVSLSELKFTTLKAGLEQYHGKPLPHLALENRFRLAHDLAVSLLNFHEVGWLQKNISSFNIGFFHHKDDSWLRALDKPHFLGYLNSRPNDDTAFTEYVENPLEMAYQHPEYSGGRGSVRYRLQFDYYSLGLILLEIGRWESLEHMSEKSGNREEMRDRLRNDKVKRLSQRMGSIYQKVVMTCLGDDFRPMTGMENSTSGDVELHLKFSDHVVNQLAICKV